MSWAHWVAFALLALSALGLHAAVLWRSPYLRLHLGSWAGTAALAAALVVPVVLAERLIEAWTEIDPYLGSGGQPTLLLYAFLVRGPLEMAVVVGAVTPFWRLRRRNMRAGLSRDRETQEGVAFSGSAALGFVTARNVAFLMRHGEDWTSLLRTAVATLAFVLLCGLWGFVLGRHATRGMGGRRFSTAWLVATIFAVVCDQLVFRRTAAALVAVTPILVCLLLATWVMWREARGGTASSDGRFSVLISAPAPSLGAIRDAFRQQDRPIMLRWIGFGAIVTTGMITVALIAAVLLGNELGVDFSAVDRVDSGAGAVAPLALLGSSAITAFPLAGYLLARASGTRSVLEPALGTSLALLLVMVFMGMLAPVSVVFAIAFAPIAFGLGCVGAWIGLAR